MDINTTVQTFTNDNLGSVRTIEIDGAIWFVAIDVAAILGYSNSRKAINDHVDPEDKNTVTIRDGIVGNPNTTIINESGLYSLILSSKMPKAKEFKRWVTSDVLPTLRKQGYYVVPNRPTQSQLDDDKPTRETTGHEYLKIAQIVASCKADRLPMVLNILAKGGWEIATPQELMRNGLADTSDAGEKIQAAMDKHHMTYAKLAEAIGFERITLYTWLIGKRYPKPKNYIKLINALEWLDNGTNS